MTSDCMTFRISKVPFLTISGRDVSDEASQNPHSSDTKCASLRHGFHVQNTSDANLPCDHNYHQLLYTVIQLGYSKLNSYKQTSSE